MISKILLSVFLIVLFSEVKVCGQVAPVDTTQVKKELAFKYKGLIIPGILIGYGAIGTATGIFNSFDSGINKELAKMDDERKALDDFTQYVPFLSVYGLNAVGIKGKNNFKDRTVILATSYLIMASTVSGLKAMVKVERPDGSSNNSFPSGHTATAFMGAEFLWQEYKDVSVWYGIGGYTVATGTGLLRLYNNRHWLTDVAAGAGIGILSTKIAYWVHPVILRTLLKKHDNFSSAAIYPYYDGKQAGIGLAMNF